MRGPVKGGLFVGAAVVVGLLAGSIVPSLVVADRETPKRAKERVAALPTMPSVVGRPLDEAEDELRRRGIEHVTNGSEILETVVPAILEVCEAEPAAGEKVRGTAHLGTALAGTCSI